ncbi:hypothetical protein D3C81_429950 [compost metagenome]
MADKGYSLSLIIKAVDRVTAPLRGIFGKVKAASAGITGALDRVGLPVFTNSLKNVGGAIGGVGNAVASSTKRLLVRGCNRLNRQPYPDGALNHYKDLNYELPLWHRPGKTVLSGRESFRPNLQR